MVFPQQGIARVYLQRHAQPRRYPLPGKALVIAGSAGSGNDIGPYLAGQLGQRLLGVAFEYQQVLPAGTHFVPQRLQALDQESKPLSADTGLVKPGLVARPEIHQQQPVSGT